MAEIPLRARSKQGEPFPSMSQEVFKSLRQSSIANVVLGKRTYSELNNTKGEDERPITQELGFGALRLGNKIRRNGSSISGNPSASKEQSGNVNAIEAGPPNRNDPRGDNSIRHKLRDKDDRDHRISGNHEDNYRQLHHDDRSRFLKPPALSTPGHYTISKDYTGGEEVRRTHLLGIYGRKCGAKRGGQVLEIQQEEETPKNQLRTPRMDPTNRQPSIWAETNETRQQGGVRKKNAGFEIPPERNLGNIDHLISESTDENEIKELKQQKRLLRNRQAALDSRQRKKQQAKRLDDETKQYTALISDMEEEMSELKRRNEQLLLEKEEMIRSHNIEAGELRKKVAAVLTEHAQRLQNDLSYINITSQSKDKLGKVERLGSDIWSSVTETVQNQASRIKILAKANVVGFGY